jgi:hypothetical protein
MALEILGPGFGRTGTKSLQKALGILGLGRCHHMFEVFRKPRQAGLFLDAMENGGADWDTVFEGYQAAVDWPSTFFWRELTQSYPEARVILTVRDEETWYESISRTILRSFMRSSQKTGAVGHLQNRMAKRIIFDLTFGGRLVDRQFAIRRFRLHNEQVRSEVDSKRLLVYNIADGWEPLCRFLQRPVPNADFPMTNTRRAFPLLLT